MTGVFGFHCYLSSTQKCTVPALNKVRQQLMPHGLSFVDFVFVFCVRQKNQVLFGPPDQATIFIYFEST